LLGFEEVAYMALFGWLAVAGPGPVSLDYLLQKQFPESRVGAPVRAV
jgi:putative oxidoreductase